MPSAPLISCSRGVVTADSTACALAPTYTLCTCTCGAASSGYWAMGSVGMLTAPTSTITIAQTDAKIGPLMKKSANIFIRDPRGVPRAPRRARTSGARPPSRESLASLLRGGRSREWRHASAGTELLHAGGDDAVAGLQPAGDRIALSLDR